jgi:hypothetical protein
VLCNYPKLGVPLVTEPASIHLHQTPPTLETHLLGMSRLEIDLLGRKNN